MTIAERVIHKVMQENLLATGCAGFVADAVATRFHCGMLDPETQLRLADGVPGQARRPWEALLAVVADELGPCRTAVAANRASVRRER